MTGTPRARPAVEHPVPPDRPLALLAAAGERERSPHSRRDRSTSDGNDMLKAATAAGRMLGLETQPLTDLEATR